MPKLAKTRSVAFRVAALAVLGGWASCSLVVETQDQQCASDADCKGFEGAVCDQAAGVCVARAAATGSTSGDSSASSGAGGGSGGGSSSGGSECVGEDGCFDCEPTVQAEFLNHCTDSECVPYDNTQLEDLLEEDGSLPSVP